MVFFFGVGLPSGKMKRLPLREKFKGDGVNHIHGSVCNRITVRMRLFVIVMCFERDPRFESGGR